MISTRPAQGFVRLPDILKRIPVGKSTIWKWVQEGRFPAPVKLSDGVTAWSVTAVEQWEAEKLTTANDK